MKRVSILLLLVFNLVAIYANEQEFRSKLTEFSSSNRTIVCDFSQEKRVQGIANSIESQGTFYYDNSGKIALIYESSSGDRVIMNGDQFTIVVDGRRMASDGGSNPMLGQIAAMMRGCMSGDISQFTNGWSMSFEINDGSYVVTLSPESRRIKRYISSIIMSFDIDDLTLNTLVMNEASGGMTSYTFTNKELNKSFDSKIFSYE